jgi:hypothetical protein
VTGFVEIIVLSDPPRETRGQEACGFATLFKYLSSIEFEQQSTIGEVVCKDQQAHVGMDKVQNFECFLKFKVGVTSPIKSISPARKLRKLPQNDKSLPNFIWLCRCWGDIFSNLR